jgi:hypothetical protein
MQDTFCTGNKGLDIDQIIEELVNDKRIDPRLIRALDRI